MTKQTSYTVTPAMIRATQRLVKSLENAPNHANYIAELYAARVNHANVLMRWNRQQTR